ncbi:archease [Candidatus Babeliales bacterium]|nr:archease [Candidatus Babeliales bacterium]MCF7899701.1 archease [Candidatus Babeliales bacterium]
MKKYEIIPHTADIKLRLEASTIQELFEIALQAMSEIISENSCTKNKDYKLTEKFEINSIDQTALLIDFLSQILTYSQINNVVYCKVEFEKLTNQNLIATIFGNKTDKFDEDVKAVTYHEAEIVKNKNNNFQTFIVFDI